MKKAIAGLTIIGVLTAAVGWFLFPAVKEGRKIPVSLIRLVHLVIVLWALFFIGRALIGEFVSPPPAESQRVAVTAAMKAQAADQLTRQANQNAVYWYNKTQADSKASQARIDQLNKLVADDGLKMGEAASIIASQNEQLKQSSWPAPNPVATQHAAQAVKYRQEEYNLACVDSGEIVGDIRQHLNDGTWHISHVNWGEYASLEAALKVALPAADKKCTERNGKVGE